MKKKLELPTILVIDDELGRLVSNGRNKKRIQFCKRLSLVDVTSGGSSSDIPEPVANAWFYRGQKPERAMIGDLVENYMEGCLDLIRKGWSVNDPKTPRWSMILLDLCFKKGFVTEESNRDLEGMATGGKRDADPDHCFGLKLLAEIQVEFPNIPVLILSSLPEDKIGERHAHLGAVDFLELGKGNEDDRKLDEVEQFRKRIKWNGIYPDYSKTIIGNSQPLLFALRGVRRAALENRHIILRGEAGTGKDLFAHFINHNALRPKDKKQARPFGMFNCRALIPSLYRSELFGHRKGVFTGAIESSKGRLLDLHGGDAFFNEIGNLHLDVQQGLLVFLENGIVEELGNVREIKIDVRFITATNANLEKMIQEGRFQHDLHPRLKTGGEFFLPPLRDRLDDLPLLTEHLLRKSEKEIGAERREITPEALGRLSEYHWPNNIRELKNRLNEAVSNAPNLKFLVPHHLVLPKKENTSRVFVPGSEAGLDNPVPPSSHTNKGFVLKQMAEIEAQAAEKILEYLDKITNYCDLSKGFPAADLQRQLFGPRAEKNINSKMKAKIASYFLLSETASVKAIRESENLKFLAQKISDRIKAIKEILKEVEQSRQGTV